MQVYRRIIDNEKHKIGDTICSCKLGCNYCRKLYWYSCPKCEKKRWVRKNIIGKLCSKCNHIDEKQIEKIAIGTKKSYENNSNLKNIRVNQMLGKKRDWSPSPSHIEIIRKSSMGNQQSLEYRKKRSDMTKILWENPKHRERIIQTSTNMWKNPDFKQRMVTKWAKSIKMKPNKAERKLNLIIQNISKRKFALNVKGNIMILGGKIPDFVNINGKKSVIELYGDYFHKGENPDDRINYFKKFGYETLIIWESELKNEPILTQKVSNWMNVNA